MKRGTKDALRRRAEGRCEYCRLPEKEVSETFHLEHIVAKQHRGGDGFDNLAFACHWCNFLKGTNLASIDPENGRPVLLFHPRFDAWEDHFELLGAMILARPRRVAPPRPCSR